MLVDSHCHLNFPELAQNLDAILADMKERGVGHALCVSVTLQEFPQVLAMAQTHVNLFASVGVHPDYDDVGEVEVSDLVALAAHPRVVAIGETGLDYYRLQGDLEWQRERFRCHIRAAVEAGKPLIVHSRAAADDTMRILREEGAQRIGGVMHCFTESWEIAQQAMELGFHISFSGIVTFRNAAALREVAQKMPLERMLVETDSPYLAPVPMRGKPNRPGYVRFVAEEIARLRNVAYEEIELATTNNFFRLFKQAQPCS